MASGEWPGREDVISRRTSRVSLEMAECVEEKTVTVTTLTKRSYPPLFVRSPTALQNLDAKEYPLAHKPTPEALASFQYKVDDGQVVLFKEEDSPHVKTEIRPSSSSQKETIRRAIDADIDTKSPTPASIGRLFKDFQQHDVKAASARFSARKIKKEPQSGRGIRSHSTSPPPKSLRFTRSRELRGELAPRHETLRRHRIVSTSALPATPDPSENEIVRFGPDPSQFDPFFKPGPTPEPGRLQHEAFDFTPAASAEAEMPSFPRSVATPPIVETDDDESFERPTGLGVRGGSSRLSLNMSAVQNVSLPSPSLSPTLAAAQLHQSQIPSDNDDVEASDSSCTAKSSEPLDDEHTFSSNSNAWSQTDCSQPGTVLESRTMIDAFDSMADEMKAYMLYQFLRRCSRKTLRVIADVVNPALKFDFLEQLPPELSLHVLSFLDYKDLCRAAQVSKRWRTIIDTNETGWKDLFDKANFTLPEGELDRAIREGWGWQDPYGPDGWEKDLSRYQATPDRDAVPGESELHRVVSESRLRGTIKRKRTATTISERVKRRAVSQEFREKGKVADLRHYKGSSANTHKKSGGPNSAASAAALAIPNPPVGLPSLRQLHLYKSLFRRHHGFRNNWNRGRQVPPHHMAFPAHPQNVITCLQFDDDKILTGSDDTFIHVYDTKTGALRKKLEGHDGGVWALQYVGNTLVSGSTDRSVRVWDIEQGICTHVFHGHTSTVRCLQILMPTEVGKSPSGAPIMSPEKPLIITGSRDSQLRVWRLPEPGSRRYTPTGPSTYDTDCPYFIRTLQGHTQSVRAIAAHQDVLVSGSYDYTVRVWKISTGETQHRLVGHTQKVYSVILDHKRNRCISGSMDTFVKIWSLESGACLYTLEGHSSLVGLLDLSEERLVSAAADSTLRIWDPENGQCKSTLTAHTGAITCFQHDGRKVISGSDRTLKMWDVKTGECLQDLLTDLSGVWQVKFDSRRCVAAVQRDSLTYVEVLDFGAVRDGVDAEERGHRILLNTVESDRITEVE